MIQRKKTPNCDQYLENAWKNIILVGKGVGMRAAIKLDLPSQ